MGGLLFYIIIIVLVMRAVNRSREQARGKETKPNEPRQPMSVQPNRAARTAKPNRSRSRVEPNKPSPRPAQSILAANARKEETKRRLREKYGVPEQRATSGTAGTSYDSEIMRRANANVDEYASNQIEEEGKTSGIPVTEGHIDNCLIEEDDCSLMDRVNDLMLMGYQAELTFERDFVAEGIEMLNRFSV